MLNTFSSIFNRIKISIQIKKKVFLVFFRKTLADSKIMRTFALAIENESIQTLVW